MVEKTLQEMRRGGIFDQVGFGFHRYSTDSIWLVPHFEKMLYDQALLALTYTEAYQAMGKNEYGETACQVLDYVLRDMTSREGAFYSADDADSEGIEGKYYVWTEDEIRSALDEEDRDLAIGFYGVTKKGNFEGNNILYLAESEEEMAVKMGVSKAALQDRLRKIRLALLSARGRRIRPHRDDKILVDWNSLMIVALARAAQSLGDPGYGQAAKLATDFILDNITKPNGRLLHRYRDGEAAIDGTLDDYAFLIWALTELYETTFEPKYIRTALDLKEQLIKHFWDDDEGGFYLTPDDGEKLLVRQKEGYDGAVPSGSSVAMLALMRLGRMVGDPDLEHKALQVGNYFADDVMMAPSGYTMMLLALDFGIGPGFEVVIAGEQGTDDTTRMIDVARKPFIPNKVVLLNPSYDPSSEISRLADFLKEYQAIDGHATAYVCQNFSCREPTTDSVKLAEMLAESTP